MNIEIILMLPMLRLVNDSVSAMLELWPFVPPERQEELSARIVSLTERIGIMLETARAACHMQNVCMN